MKAVSALILTPALAALALLPGLPPSGAAEGGKADGADLPAARKVTLSGDRPLSAALQEFHKQTGIVVEDRRGTGDDPSLKLNLAGVSSWQALDGVADAADARLFFYPRDGRVALVKRAAGVPPQPVSYAGPYRIALKRVTASHDFERNDDSCLATLEVCWEPHLPPILLENRQAKVAVTVKGTPGANLPSARLLEPVDGRFASTFDVRLPAVPRTATKFDAIAGELQVIGPTRLQTFDFGPLAKLPIAADKPPPPVTKMQGAITCSVDWVKLAADRWQVHITVNTPRTRPDLLGTNQHEAWIANNELALVSKTDPSRRLVTTNWTLENDPTDKAVIVYHFTDGGGTVRGKAEDWTVTYRTQEDLKEMTVPFTFKDVRLP